MCHSTRCMEPSNATVQPRFFLFSGHYPLPYYPSSHLCLLPISHSFLLFISSSLRIAGFLMLVAEPRGRTWLHFVSAAYTLTPSYSCINSYFFVFPVIGHQEEALLVTRKKQKQPFWNRSMELNVMEFCTGKKFFVSYTSLCLWRIICT